MRFNDGNYVVLLIRTIRPEQNLAPWSWNNTLTPHLCIDVSISTGWDVHVKLLQLSLILYFTKYDNQELHIFSVFVADACLLKQITGKMILTNLIISISHSASSGPELPNISQNLYNLFHRSVGVLTKCKVQVRINRRYSIMVNCCIDSRDPK